MKFRYDINALRAIAVISVVIFHFYPALLTGGFAGVDVFFVISGFLMTGIIMRGFEKNNFNLIQFYIARCNRIIPALAVLCLVLVVLGWFILLPTEYKALGKHAASSVSFLSNMIYWKEAGYFDTSSLGKWLLHTWSLSVEWQFYMLYPIFLILIRKAFNIRLFPAIIYTIFIFSLMVGVYLSYRAPSFAYFSLFGRAWELLLGGCIYFVSLSRNKPNNSNYYFYTGVALIAVSVVYIDSSIKWPGYLALVPTVGAALILISNSQNNFIVKNSVIQKLGLYSYSIYLWHWPIVVFLHYFDATEYAALGILISIFLGYLSFTYIESVKFQNISRYKKLWGNFPAYSVLIIIISGSTVYLTNGFMKQYPADIQMASLESINVNPYRCTDTDYCRLGNQEKLGAILVGDSHADAIATGLSSYLGNINDSGVDVYTKGFCPFIVGAHLPDREKICIDANDVRFKSINNHNAIPVIIAGRWSAYIYGQNAENRIHENNGKMMHFNNGDNKNNTEKRLLNFENYFGNMICEISKKNRNIYIVQPIPEMKFDIPETYMKNYFHNQSKPLFISQAEYLERSGAVREIIQRIATKCNVQILDPAEYLCSGETCSGTINNRSIYYDSDHLSEYGNKFLIPMFEEIMKNNKP